MAKEKASAALFDQLQTAIEGGEGEEIVGKVKGTVLFNIDGEKWTLVLNPEERKVFKGEPEGKPTLTLTISDENFVKLVMGKMGPQQAFLMRKLKIGGSMALALKLQPILDAAAPRAKL
ncbi:g8343 [Coccomyxa viridis]|uniref:G8343 protein n=1 Tax=Coccomyxa viridis TaxID=1274662 RepID=A0ABP1G099_9CHLO